METEKPIEKTRTLYAYFGLTQLNNIDSPGHSLYQLGLLDSISETFGKTEFDIFSYYPSSSVLEATHWAFPDTPLGEVFKSTHEELINGPCVHINDMMDWISNKAYDKLYLKARFRNLSTLSKKWKDAAVFEEIIAKAIETGYLKSEIIILDTDLSLPSRFIREYGEYVTILIPSIDFPGISDRFLTKCQEARNVDRSGVVYYGNVDTSSYKAGNAKDPKLVEFIQYIRDFPNTHITVIHKPDHQSKDLVGVGQIDRSDRSMIFGELERSSVMLNVTKPKYETDRFIPARVYEAMIFGNIPISLGFDWLCLAFSFKNTDDLHEILTYLLSECDQNDLTIAYNHFVKSYRAYVASIQVFK